MTGSVLGVVTRSSFPLRMPSGARGEIDIALRSYLPGTRPASPERGESGCCERSEDGVPVVADADDRPTLVGGSPERFLGAGGVVELALGVVVEHEQAQRRPVLALAEVEHLD